MVLLALVQILMIWVFHFKPFVAFVVVTPKYLILSTFPILYPQGCKKPEFYELAFRQLHHVAFDRLNSHTPFPSPTSKTINIFLKFHCILNFFDFTVTNTVISKAKNLVSDSMSADISLMYKENNKGPRTVPFGTPDTTGAQSDLTPFTTPLCCLKQGKAFIHFVCPTYSVAK